MPTSSTYYLNAPSLSSANAVFLDADLSTCAPNGYYTDGIVVRQQVDCNLLEPLTCNACGVPCPDTVSLLSSNGVYYVDVALNEFIGLMIVTLNPYSNIVGIEVTYDSVVYNTISSGPAGVRQGPAGLPTYVGNNTTDPTCYAGLVGSHLLNKYNYVVSSFVADGTETVTVTAPEDQTDTFNPGDCFIAIPKPTSNPQSMQIKLITVCEDTQFDLTFTCPQTLPSYESSLKLTGSELYWCTTFVGKIYYHYSIADTPGVIGIGDFVFSDTYGLSPLPDGNYKADLPYPLIYTVSGGIIVSFMACP